MMGKRQAICSYTNTQCLKPDIIVATLHARFDNQYKFVLMIYLDVLISVACNDLVHWLRG